MSSQDSNDHTAPGGTRNGLSRRGLFGAVGAGAALIGAGAAAGRLSAPEAHSSALGDVVEFYGDHQAGIVTPAQDRMHFVAFDVVTESRDELIDLLRTWTDVAGRLTRGAET